MRKINLKVFPNVEATSQAAAKEVVAVGTNAITDHGKFFLVLAGGTTPKRLYELLARPPLRDQLDWTCVEFFWGDERPVPPEHDDSNYHLAKKALLEPLRIADSQVHRMPGEASDLKTAAEAYQNEIAEALGAQPFGEPPSFDLVLLGLGDDGHTASLFPATPALLDTRRWVTANRVLKLESTRLTMTPMLINRAANIFFLVTGGNKAAALAEVVEGPIDTQRLPAQIIRPSGGNVQWFVDEAAAGKLSKK